MSEYGELQGVIAKLESNADRCAEYWNDQTARTYAPINENMKNIAGKVTAIYTGSEKAYKTINNYYDSGQYDYKVAELRNIATGI